MNRTARRLPALPSRLPSRRCQRGVSLVESSVATALAAVATGIVAPGFEQAIQRRHLEGAAAQFETDVHHARSLAVARNQPLRISFASSAAGSCYVLHTGAAGACGCGSDDGQPPVCTGGAEAQRSVRFAAGERVGLQANVRSMVFDPVLGTATPTATVRFTARSGAALHQVVNLMGRVRACTPDAALPGYRRC